MPLPVVDVPVSPTRGARLFRALRRAFAAAATVAGTLVAGCETPTTPPTDRVAMLLSLTADQSGGAVAARVTITGVGIPEPLVARATFVDNVATVSLDVPVGTDRTALVEILDASDAVIASGSSTFDVLPGVVANVSVPVVSTSGTLTVTVTIGTVTVTVTGPTGPLAAGATRQLTARVLDGTGADIPGAVVLWATSNPGIATISATGLVTALRAGTVEISATSRGAGTRVPLTIAGPADNLAAPARTNGRSLIHSVP